MAQQTVEISENAAKKIHDLLVRQQKEGQGFDAPRDGDRIFERDDVKVLVDRKSFLYLRGTELDYSEALMDSGFKLRNPNVKRSCGCGSSFSV